MPGYRSTGAVHPPHNECKPEPSGSRKGAEGQTEEWTDPRGAASENVQGLCSGGSFHRCTSSNI